MDEYFAKIEELKTSVVWLEAASASRPVSRPKIASLVLALASKPDVSALSLFSEVNVLMYRLEDLARH